MNPAPPGIQRRTRSAQARPKRCHGREDEDAAIDGHDREQAAELVKIVVCVRS